jgi:hypothetical protein
MPQLCSKCSRANPPEAIYCHFDGFVLGGHEKRGGPVSVGSQPFNSPFVFPTGRTCRSFDELALACQDEWSVACELLRDGYLETFFGGLGRVDLARAAKEAARFPDIERGLDQLLEKVPSTVLTEPKLTVKPEEVSLGVLDSTKERKFELELENTGGRLLYGTASSTSPDWISLGEAGAQEKHFQFTHEMKVPVHVRPGTVRASNKPIEARILIESNGGTITVILKAEKPVKPFPHGPFKGAKTPREVAKKAMEASKEVGPLFESGEVERWYESNGWIYPVKTPAASGLAAIQQFFEALGLTKPPKVEISEREFLLTGDPGDKIPLSLEVTTQEKKAVWAHATSNVPWLEVSKPKFEGRKATVNMSVPSIPDRPGETLEGELTVIGNGNVRWLVPVRLAVSGELVAAAVVDEVDEVEEVVEAAPAAAPFDFAAPEPPPLPPRPKTAPEEKLESPRPKSKPEITEEPPRRTPPPPPVSDRRRRQEAGNPLPHLIPAALLAIAVLLVIVLDVAGVFTREHKPDDKPDDTASAGGGGTKTEAGTDAWKYDLAKLKDKKPHLAVQYNKDNRFGILQLDATDPENPDTQKRLTYSEDGGTNNTIVKIAGNEYTFGFASSGISQWQDRQLRVPLKPAYRKGYVSRMYYTVQKVQVIQHVEIVPSKSGYLDTCLVYYTISNKGDAPQKVGIRFLLDTFIGANDGVPFTIPGRKGFVTDKLDLLRNKSRDEIPDYLEVIEKPDDPNDPGTVARLGLRNINLPNVKLTEPSMVRICRFPGSYAKWDWDTEDMRFTQKERDAKEAIKGQNGDSCVAIYWPEETLEPKEARHYAFTYGLGELNLEPGVKAGKLALSVDNRPVLPERTTIVTCYVYNPRPGQKVKLELPDGLELAGGEQAEKEVDATRKGRDQVFWRVKAIKEGKHPVKAVSGDLKSKPANVIVQAKSIFG